MKYNLNDFLMAVVLIIAGLSILAVSVCGCLAILNVGGSAIIVYLVLVALAALFVISIDGNGKTKTSEWNDPKDAMPPYEFEGASITVIVKTKKGYWYTAWYNYRTEEWINDRVGGPKYIDNVEYWLDPNEIK